MSHNVNGPSGGVPSWNAWLAGQTTAPAEGGSQTQSTQPTSSPLLAGLAQLNQQHPGSQGMMGAFLSSDYDPFENSRRQMAEQREKLLSDIKSGITAIEGDVPLEDIVLTDLMRIMQLIESKVKGTDHADSSEIVQLRSKYRGEYKRRLLEQAEQQKLSVEETEQGKNAIDDDFDWNDDGSHSDFGNESD
jgi:hypothetical protein